MLAQRESEDVGGVLGAEEEVGVGEEAINGRKGARRNSGSKELVGVVEREKLRDAPVEEGGLRGRSIKPSRLGATLQ